jgi:hypothetical protein
MLVAAWMPWIANLAGRLDAAEREDFEQAAVVTLLEEIGRAPLGPYTARALKLALLRRHSTWGGATRGEAESECFDEEEHGGAAEGPGDLEGRLAAMVASECARVAEPGLAEALLCAPSVAAYVRRAWPDAHPSARRHHQRRLVAARRRVIGALRRRLPSLDALAA